MIVRFPCACAVVALVAACGPALLAQSVPAGLDSDQVLAGLAKQWEAQRSEIQTARISVAFFHYFPAEGPPLSQTECLRFIAELEKTVGSGVGVDQLKELTASLPIEPYQRNWKELTILVDGERVRNITTLKSRDGTLETWDSAFDGKHEVQHLGDSEQASVFRGRSRWRLYYPADVRFLPLSVSGLRAGPTADGHISLLWDRGTLEVERQVSFHA